MSEVTWSDKARTLEVAFGEMTRRRDDDLSDLSALARLLPGQVVWDGDQGVIYSRYAAE